MAIAIICASPGGMLAWLAGPSKGLLLIARSRATSRRASSTERAEVEVNILVVQGAVTTLIALLSLVPSVSSAYWILSVITTQII